MAEANAPDLRARLRASVSAEVEGCSAVVGAEQPVCPIVACGRHKALAVDVVLEQLGSNEAAALAELDAAMEAGLHVGRLDLAPTRDARVAEVHAAAAAKRVLLQQEAVAADAALEEAIAAAGAVSEATSLGDAELVAVAPALLERFEAARAAVMAVPVTPEVSSFLALAHPPLTPETLQSAPPDAIFGRLLPPPFLAPHIHSPHCKPECSFVFAPHKHSPTCNHAAATSGEVWEAAKRGDAAALRAALIAGGSTEEANSLSRTALAVAAMNGHMEALCELIAAGADVASRDVTGASALHHAAANGHEAIIRLLLTDPAVDPNLPQPDQATPLHWAAICGSAPVVGLFIADKRVDVNARNWDGKTALDVARASASVGQRQESADVVSLLEADPRVRQ